MHGRVAADDLGVIYGEHAGWLRGWLHTRTRCREWAADLTQDTFQRLLERQGSASIRDPRNLLTVIARRLLIDDVRRRDVEQAYLACHAASGEAACMLTPERVVEAVQLVEGLVRLLEGLPRQVAHAFLLRKLDGLTHDAIAQQLGISDRTVKRHIARAFAHCYTYVSAE